MAGRKWWVALGQGVVAVAVGVVIGGFGLGDGVGTSSDEAIVDDWRRWQVAVGGFQTQGDAETVTKGVPTSGRIASGGIIEREVEYDISGMTNVKLTLRNPDFTTARRVSQAINAFLGTAAAAASDPTTIQLAVPRSYRNNVVNLLTDIEQLRVEPDQLARVVIDEQTGTIVKCCCM